MYRPSFLIIGAPRSGTTSLYNYLYSHPEVYMSPVKETRFFAYKNKQVTFQGPTDKYTINKQSVTEPHKYDELFAKVDPKQHKAVGEASPVYMYEAEKAVPSIYSHNPEMKLIVILRNPVDRAFSDYLNMKRLGRDLCPTFEEAINKEKQRIKQNWSPFYHYLSKGFYYNQLKHYFQYFDRSQFYITTFEEFTNRTATELNKISKFLGVTGNYKKQKMPAHNKSGIPKNMHLHKILTHPLLPIPNFIKNRNIIYKKLKLSYKTRKELVNHFKEDIENLELILNKNLSHWKTIK